MKISQNSQIEFHQNPLILSNVKNSDGLLRASNHTTCLNIICDIRVHEEERRIWASTNIRVMKWIIISLPQPEVNC
jgi:hypothetical protein